MIQQRVVCILPRIGKRVDVGIYNQMLELCNKEPRALAMYDDLTERHILRLIRQSSNFRVTLGPGIKVTFNPRHLASRAKYKYLRFARR